MGILSNKNFHSLLVEMRSGTATLEDSLPISYKANHSLNILYSNCILSIYPTDLKNQQLVSSLVTKSCPTLVTPQTVACQAPLSTGFSRHEYLSGLPFSSPGDLPNLRIEPWSPALQANSLRTELRVREALVDLKNYVHTKTCT